MQTRFNCVPIRVKYPSGEHARADRQLGESLSKCAGRAYSIVSLHRGFSYWTQAAALTVCRPTNNLVALVWWPPALGAIVQSSPTIIFDFIATIVGLELQRGSSDPIKDHLWKLQQGTTTGDPAISGSVEPKLASLIYEHVRRQLFPPCL